MKRSNLFLLLCLLCGTASAQIIDPKKAAERKAADRTNSRIDQSIDKGLDKVEEGIGSLFKKKPKKQNEEQTQTGESSSGSSQEEQRVNEQPSDRGASTSSGASSFSSFSKFDFIPGEKVIAFEDFSQDAIGDFPAKWNTNGSGEVVTIGGKEGKWLKFTNEGFFYPEFVNVLDENCTIEFEMGSSEAQKVLALMYFVDSKTFPNPLRHGSTNLVEVYFDPAVRTEIVCRDKESEVKLSNRRDNVGWLTPANSFVKISVWRQKTRLRVYMNEMKVWDVPRAFEPGVPYRLLFGTDTKYQEDRALFMSNLRVAKGQPDTRSKLIAEGKFVTNGILFDVNSDRIKGESYGVLQEIATVMKENPTVKIRISGHTDSDGDDKSNLALSQKRAIAIKNALSKDFGVEAGRMETDGFGESKPIDSNTTGQGKANNRRAEFTKL